MLLRRKPGSTANTMTLRDCFDGHCGRVLGKIDHFFDVYETHLARFRNTPVRVLEIGVDQGGSLELWRSYFGAGADIHGIDIDPLAAERAPADCTVHIGSQGDEAFLHDVSEQNGPFEIVIDDGSHEMGDQISSFEVLYPRLSENGLYICEDAFTSYWTEYDGGQGVTGTFIDYASGLVDELHAFWAAGSGAEPSEFTRTTRGIHFYSGAVVFEREPVKQPVYVTRGGSGLATTSIEELQRAAARRPRKP